jgi:2-C-methyl-D-erythritol 4-phosphate cytidylyltransferase
MNTALIVAGGSGLRMQASVRKQFLLLDGLPVIARTVLAFSSCTDIDRIILVLPKDDLAMVKRDILSKLTLNTSVDLVAGGAQRQDSVFNGLKKLDPDCRVVAIHDGVRPFVTPRQISKCIAMAEDHGACLLGLPVVDTLKRVSQDQTVEKTLDRHRIWTAQTPQAFRVDLIKRAHLQARKDNIIGTDDAALVERLGIRVQMIHGSWKNIKITTPQDWQFSEAVIQLNHLAHHSPKVNS